MKRVLLSGAGPEEFQAHTYLLEYVRFGFAQAYPQFQVYVAPFFGITAALDSFQPDYLICVGSILPAQAQSLRYGWKKSDGRKLILWLTDEPYEHDASIDIPEHVDWLFCSDRNATQFFDAATNVSFLPLAACPVAHARHLTQRVYQEALFVGARFHARDLFLKRFAELVGKTSVRVLGDRDIPALTGGTRHGWISNSVLAGHYALALAVLNVPRDVSLANKLYAVAASTPPPRTFEAGMAGACQIYCSTADEIQNYFEPGLEILVADSVGEAAEIFGGLRRHPERSMEIGRAAQKRAAAEHTYASRTRELVSVAF